MSANLNIFEQLNRDSEGEDFFEVINRPQESTKFSGVQSENQMDNRNIFDSLNEEQQQETGFGFLQTARDIGEQVATKGLAGVGGSYGNILETFGLQRKPGEMLPGEQARNALQFQILEKLDRGETPSAKSRVKRIFSLLRSISFLKALATDKLAAVDLPILGNISTICCSMN